MKTKLLNHTIFTGIIMLLIVFSGLPIPALAQSLYTLHPMHLGGGPNIKTPPAPHSVNSGALWYRWTPLCRDGSGDHEWSLDNTQGTAPTCIDAVTGEVDDDEVVLCADGTRSLYYVDKAVDAKGSDLESNDWLWFFPGGSNCGYEAYLGASVGQTTNSPVQTGEMCHFYYTDPRLGGVTSLSSSDEGEAASGLGFLNPNSQHNPYRSFNRVRFENCSGDRFTGDKTHTNVLTDYDENGIPVSTDSYNLHFHGRRMIQAVLNDLHNGITYNEADISKNLPPIQDAENVLISAHSNGSIGLVHNLDQITQNFQAISNNSEALNIRGYLDAAIRPGIENELAHFAGAQTSSVYDFSGLAWTGVSVWGDIFAFNSSEYKPGGQVREKWDSWSNSVPDQSCINHHPGEEFRCYSLEHVWMNHITTPIFVSNRLQDTLQVHKPVDFDGLVNWNAIEYKRRLVTQINDFVAGVNVLNEESSGIEPGIFITNGTQHSGVTDNIEAFNVCLDNGDTQKSLVDAVYEWHIQDLPFQGFVNRNSSIEARTVLCN